MNTMMPRLLLVVVIGYAPGLLDVPSAHADSGLLSGLGGKCVSVKGGNPADGTPLILWSCHGQADQQWELQANRTLRGLAGKCASVNGGNPADGTNLILWPCHGQADQQWELQADGTLRGLAGKCVDAAGANSADGTPLVLWSCHGQPNQQWNAGQAAGKEVWGFADLHTHPASHLAFGSDANGENGIFHGKPGMRLADAQDSIFNDLNACVPEIHSGLTLDYVQHEARKQTMQVVDKMGGGWPHWPHEASGAPEFKNWPAAQSISHQQMHISDIRRAYDGGLRFLVASVTDNQFLNVVWHNHIGAYSRDIFNPSPSFDLKSAIKQIAFIKELDSSNPGWMEIVFTAQQARTAIHNGKLAIVLGLEMDWLTLDQIMELINEHGVRLVGPIHLADNSFGGAAVYNDAFNTNTDFLNHKFFSVEFDQHLGFRLSSFPEALYYQELGFVKKGIAQPTLDTVNYTSASGGHKNKSGLNKDAFKHLMRKGILLDLAHMGEKSIEDALTLAKEFGYPLLDSHTGLRDESKLSESERHLSFSQAGRLAALGGVIGVGATGGLIAPVPNPCDMNARNQCISQAEAQYAICTEVRADIPKSERPQSTQCDITLNAARDRCERQSCQAHSRVSSWLDGYNVALDLMGGRGIALGTDTNGLSPLFPPASGGEVLYPFSVAQEYSPPHTVVSSMNKHRIGSRTYHFQEDGLATYGMLPDFLQTLNRMPSPHDPKRALKALYHSAEDTIQMWEKVEQASQNVRPSSSTTIPAGSTPTPPRPPEPPKEDPGPKPCPKSLPECKDK